MWSYCLEYKWMFFLSFFRLIRTALQQKTAGSRKETASSRYNHLKAPTWWRGRVSLFENTENIVICPAPRSTVLRSRTEKRPWHCWPARGTRTCVFWWPGQRSRWEFKIRKWERSGSSQTRLCVSDGHTAACAGLPDRRWVCVSLTKHGSFQHFHIQEAVIAFIPMIRENAAIDVMK